MKKRIIGLVFSFCAMTILATDSITYAYDADEATNYYNQGIDFYSQNEIENSMNSFKKAISIDPEFYELEFTYMNAGYVTVMMRLQ